MWLEGGTPPQRSGSFGRSSRSSSHAHSHHGHGRLAHSHSLPAEAAAALTGRPRRGSLSELEPLADALRAASPPALDGDAEQLHGLRQEGGAEEEEDEQLAPEV